MRSNVLITALTLSALFSTLVPASVFADVGKPNVSATSQTPDNSIMQAMQTELARAFPRLKAAGPAPVHYLAYRIYDDRSLNISASCGGIDHEPEETHTRLLNVELRVGTPKLDSAHRSRNYAGYFLPWHESQGMPIEDNEDAIKAAIWNETDTAYKNAQRTFKEVQTNKDVLVAEEDESDDFSKEPPSKFTSPDTKFGLDVNQWLNELREASNIFKAHPKIEESHVTLRANKMRRYMVSSEGTQIEEERIQYDVFALARATADDGMQVWLYNHFEGPTSGDLPDQKALSQMVASLADDVDKLRTAKPAEPYAGPVILKPKAAGVFFHEVFGHRAEGHRQKDADEGRTFTKMIGKQVMPTFISVIDDPTRDKLAGHWLNGYYHYDDEGIPAQKVTLVDHGVLKSFLMGRSPIKGFDKSNGHGRSSPGTDPVARQGNLMVQSSKTVPYSQLRQMLIAEARRQGKPYGLVFDELAGGFTITQNWLPQVFKLLPLRVYRVYTDGRPDELLRGVSIIGTPLVSLEHITAAANDCDTFNGNCGAESGWVPVSASSPSLLLQTLEIERQAKSQDRPPILPPPSKGS